jgi:hypothetical protein
MEGRLFDSTSRYAKIETTTATGREGRVITYVRRRFVPPAGSLPLLVEVSVREGDRIDLIAEQTLGNPEVYWRICDANPTLEPHELVDEVGRVLRVPLPQV